VRGKPWRIASGWSALFEVAFAAAAVHAVTPLFAVAHPPIQDLPQHLAAVRVLADYGDPDLGFAQYFEVVLFRTQYLGYYLAAIVLSWPLGVLRANLLLLAVAVAGTPYALRFLLRSLGRDGRLAVLAFPLLWNAHLILGFLNFVAAIPLALLGLGLAARLRLSPTRRDAVLLGVVTVVTFTMHVVPFAFLGLGAALLGLDVRDPRGTVRRWTPLVPGALATLVWTQLAPAGRSTLDAASGAGGAQFVAPLRALSEVPMWLTDVLQGSTDDALLVAYGLLVVFAAAAAPLGGRAKGPAVPPGLAARIGAFAPLAAILYFVTPASYDWIWPINARFPLLALLFAIVALPRARGWVGAVVLIGGLGLGVAMTEQVREAFVRVEEEEVGALDEALEAIPEGARVAALVFDRGSRHVKFSPFIHSAGWVQARRGGAVMFTFADFPQSPFVFREDRRPPRVPPRWEWTPERVRPDPDLDWYTHVLTRGGPGRIARDPDWERIFEADRWRVFRRR
jgi:hypothetical protein